MYLLVLYLPLINAIICGFFSRLIGSRGSCVISMFSMFFTVLSSLFIFYEIVLLKSICYFKIAKWIDCEFLNLEWGFLFDNLTSIMLLVVNIVSFLVHIFSINYMKTDPHLSRFMSYLSLFTFFMLILVTADNFVQMFLGWEGVGLASYLLINFWFTRLQANKSALKAIILNRIGDFGLVISLAAIFFLFKSLDYSIVFSMSYFFKEDFFSFFGYKISVLTFISLFLFLGAVGKSAQMGLHVWLPDAMEGPTPVSALIHAATMVTAGVFVLIRCSPLLEYGGFSLLIITVIGSLTAFFAATTGLLQNDLKKVIAYSTCSQLGYMVFACGLSNYSVALFHLFNHAFFKALLFLSAGAIIHALNDEQDMRKMGGLFKILPFVYMMFLIGSLSLMGFPFLTGFYSKDMILELSYSSYTIEGSFSYWLGTLSAFFTAFYSFRLIFLTFLTKTNGFKKSYENVHEIDLYMGIPLIILSFGSIFIGYFMKDLIIGLGTDFWSNVLLFLPDNVSSLECEFIPLYIKICPVVLSICALFLSLFLYSNYMFLLYRIKKMYIGRLFYNFINKKWYFDYFYYLFFVYSIFYFGYHISFKLIDRGLIELCGPLGFVRFFSFFSVFISKLHTGLLNNYGLLLVQGILLFFLFYFINDILFI